MKRLYRQHGKTLRRVSQPPATHIPFLHHHTSHYSSRHALRLFCVKTKASSWVAVSCSAMELDIFFDSHCSPDLKEMFLNFYQTRPSLLPYFCPTTESCCAVKSRLALRSLIYGRLVRAFLKSPLLPRSFVTFQKLHAHSNHDKFKIDWGTCSPSFNGKMMRRKRPCMLLM